MLDQVSNFLNIRDPIECETFGIHPALRKIIVKPNVNAAVMQVDS
jgi:hypothetical protein